VAVDRLAWHRAFVVGDHWKTLPRKDTNGARPVTGFDESDTRRVLAEYGLHTPKAIVATSATTAVEAAQRIGYPVVLKVVSKRIPHKTEAGGVALGVKDDHAVALQYGRVWNNARHFLNGDDPDGVLVQEQFEDGIEFIVGATVDDHLGAFVLVGLGGVLTEMLNDVVLHPAPVDAAIADRMISRLQGAPLLDGFRGRPPADRAALVDTVVKLSHVAADYRHVVAEADLNPVLVLPAGEGVRVVDALFVPRR
jgi:acyl-CoA synthetase (NDP forming)